MPIKIYPRVIDLVQAVRNGGGVPNSVKYAKGNPMYNNIMKYIEEKYKAPHRQAMDAAKYFMF
jgi:hypothetical protein